MKRKPKIVVSRAELITEAASLASEHGENSEYDRALAEMIYWTAGGDSIESVTAEIDALRASAIKPKKGGRSNG